MSKLTLCILLLLVIVPSALAQSPTPTPTPTLTPVPDITLEEPTITIEAAPLEAPEPSPIQEAVGWLAATLGVWAIWSASVSTTLEKVKEQVDPFLSVLGDSGNIKPIRALVIVVLVFVAGFITVRESGYNVFANAPSWIVLDADWQTLITGVFLSVGAFLFHDVPLAWRNQQVLEELLKPPAG